MVGNENFIIRHAYMYVYKQHCYIFQFYVNLRNYLSISDSF